MSRFNSMIKAVRSPVQEIPPLLQPGHIPSLDGLRGFSIIIVLVYHVLLANGYTRFNGIFGVNIFFVISGFIITTILMKEKVKTGSISLGRFYWRRSLKILPPAFIYLSVIFLLNTHYRFITTQDILSAALFIKNTSIISTHWDVATGHFWSLSVEEQFYLVFPFILKKGTNSYLAILAILIVLIPIALAKEHAGVGAGLRLLYDLIRHITPILTGALFAMLVFKKVIVKRLYPNNLFVNLLLLLAAYAIFDGAGLLSGLYYKNFISSVLVAMVIVNNISEPTGLFFKALNSKLLATIGLASYSIYIWQQLFILWHPWGTTHSFASSVWFNLAVLLLVSFGSYYFIERKIGILKSRYK